MRSKSSDSRGQDRPDGGHRCPKRDQPAHRALEDVGPDTPLSLEILAPILAFYVADDFEQAIESAV